MAVVLAAVLCLMMLAHSVRWFAGQEPGPQPHTLAPIEMQLIETGPPPTAAPALEPATVARAVAVPRAKPSTIAPPPRHFVAAAPSRQAPPASPLREAVQQHLAAPATPDQHEEPAAPSSQTAAALATPDTSSKPSTSTSSNAPPSPTSGNTQARLLSQPMPVLPDDLREQGYQLTAIAHFRIHADGSVEVELVKPTQNPRLNQILLETLHRWRFFPAMENGRPVDSDQDVRVHFSVS